LVAIVAFFGIALAECAASADVNETTCVEGLTCHPL
jgi:hypothetical protein